MWKILLPVIAASLIGWGAWNTLATTNATPREVFDAHCKEANQKFERMQNRIEDKLDKIQEKLME
jgi:hypothetical protein